MHLTNGLKKRRMICARVVLLKKASMTQVETNVRNENMFTNKVELLQIANNSRRRTKIGSDCKKSKMTNITNGRKNSTEVNKTKLSE